MKGVSLCQRCGQCCENGGPALHREDLILFEEGILGEADLVTIRAGERVRRPAKSEAEPLCSELVKIGGKAGSWACRYLNTAEKSCQIYARRPCECRHFLCSKPGLLLAMIGHDNLTRRDLLPPDDPAWEYIVALDRECPPRTVDTLLTAFMAGSDQKGSLQKMQHLVTRDVALRTAALATLGIHPGRELFLFGRPLFVLLAPFGFLVTEENGRLFLKHPTLEPGL